MAVMRNSIIFGGVDSADFGIYIGGEGTFNAPKRDVEMISIPGRNGAFALDKGRFQNIEVTYSAFNSEPDLDTFSAHLEAFRNAICSQKGYQRLTDTFHPDEYRMAAYIDGLEIKPIEYNTAATFDIKFDCKPQRFLASGEEPVTIGEWHETETASGEIASFEAKDGDAAKSLVADIEPIQDLHGYDKPWSGGVGKNKLPYPYSDGTSKTTNGITYTVDANGVITANGTATADNVFYCLSGSTSALANKGLASGTYILSGSPSTSASSNYYLQIQYNGTFLSAYASGAQFTYNASGGGSDLVRIFVKSGAVLNNVKFYPMIRLSSVSDATFEPYSNICPISGYDSVDIWNDPKYGGSIVWNQLGTIRSSVVTSNGVTFTPSTGQIATTGTASGGNASCPSYASSINVTKDHKYLILGCPSGGNTSNRYCLMASTVTATGNATDTGNGKIFNALADGQTNLVIIVYNGFNSAGLVFKSQFFDLTTMFGATKANEIYAMEQATAGSGVAYFKSLFPKDFYAYNSGETTCVSAVNGDPYKHYTINLNGTRYGGTLDVASGVLTVTKGIVDLGTLNWSYISSTSTFYADIQGGPLAVNEGNDGLCSIYPIFKGQYSAMTDKAVTIANTYLSSAQGRTAVKDTSYSSASAFKTAMNGVQLVYPLATPTTVQLTAQEVELLVGLNQVWANSGDVSVEYGTAPNAVYNPTLFESSPMLEVEGYGTIVMGGQDIAIQNIEVGKVILHSPATSAGVTLNVSLLNAGDAIYGNSSTQPEVALTMKLSNTSNTLTASIRAAGVTNGTGYVSRTNRYTSVLHVSPFTGDRISFTNGTGETITTTVPLQLEVNTTVTNCTLTLTTTYNASTDQITMSASRSGFPSGMTFQTYYKHPSYYGDSTKTLLPSPMYIDLDLGEAYGEVSGEMASFNNLVSLPAELPKLKVGDTGIAYDNTITDLKVIPRWWKI